ncbi:MAG: hypothetical protein JSW29_03270, partial [Candidatus Bathyarchaeota archaeon]
MKSKLFAQIAIALLLVSIFSLLPVATTPLMFSTGKVNAVRFDALGKGLPSGVTAESTGEQKPKMTYNLDMIDTENILGDGEGVYVAVIDCGLLPNWRSFFPEEKIVTEWATAF